MAMLIRAGWMWVDSRRDRNLREKVLAAARRYRGKFGRPPDICYINAAHLDRPEIEVQGVRVVGAPNIPPHHFWLGEIEG